MHYYWTNQFKLNINHSEFHSKLAHKIATEFKVHCYISIFARNYAHTEVMLPHFVT